MTPKPLALEQTFHVSLREQSEAEMEEAANLGREGKPKRLLDCRYAR